MLKEVLPSDKCNTLAIFFIVASTLESAWSISVPNSSNILSGQGELLSENVSLPPPQLTLPVRPARWRCAPTCSWCCPYYLTSGPWSRPVVLEVLAAVPVALCTPFMVRISKKAWRQPKLSPVGRVRSAGQPAVLAGPRGCVVRGGSWGSWRRPSSSSQALQVAPALVGQSLLHQSHLLFGGLNEPFPHCQLGSLNSELGGIFFNDLKSFSEVILIHIMQVYLNSVL